MNEQTEALRQGHGIASEDGYFEARPQIDSMDRRKVFGAGFERGWEAALAAEPAQERIQALELEVRQLTEQIAGLRHAPTPQADSQPAQVEVADAMADSQYLAGVSAGWNAANADDPNAALQKLQESRAGYLKPLRAARATADSVTAPAGFVPVAAFDRLHAHAESLAERLLAAEQAAPTPPTHAADSALEDTARLNWLALAGPTSICVVIDRPHDVEVEVATDDVTGYGKTLREALDAARKQGANHD